MRYVPGVAVADRLLPVNRWLMDLLGVYHDPAAVARDFGALDASDAPAWSAWEDAALDRQERDKALMDGGRTWTAFPARRMASGLVTPWELPAKRYLTTHAMSSFLMTLYDAPRSYPGGQAEFVAACSAHQALWSAIDAAANYLIPVEVLAAFEDHERVSDELRDDLRVPFGAVNVWFAEPLLVTAEELALTTVELHGRSVVDPDATVLCAPTAWVFPLMAAALTSTVWLDGVQLRAASDGSLADPFLWLVHIEYLDSVVFCAVPADVHRSHLGSFVELVAAVAGWARWDEADDPTAGFSTGDLRRALRSGSLRKAARSGWLNPGVHTLDLRSSVRRPSAEGGSRSVSAHVRRGHWRRVRCGPKDAWRYEYRWILPTVVGGQVESGPARVYRLRVPKAAAGPTRGDETY